jgi:D-alanyl-D-alanine carboxypeptidase
MKRHHRLVLGLSLLAAIVVLAVVFVVKTHHVSAPSSSSASSSSDSKDSSASSTPSFDKKLYSLDDPTSLWVIVNKQRSLSPATYAPQLGTPAVGLRLSASTPEMQLSTKIIPAVEELFAAAKSDGLDLIVASGYRSYNEQVTVYGNEVTNYGQQTADRESARPGFSEHQTGLALDVGAASRACEVEACFGDMAEGKWIAANAYKYGFVVRYGSTTEAVTGYTYEPWHIRYVGKDLSDELHTQGDPPLETFFGLSAAPDYR